MKNKSSTDVFTERFNSDNKKKIRHAENQIKKTYDKTFYNELDCLFFLNRFLHSNIISLFDFYIYEKRYNFLFFNYEINFRAFFQSEFWFKDFNWDFIFFSVFRGLISAFCSIHKFYLEKKKHDLNIDVIDYYYDFQPANVLISQDTFILADFGIEKIKSKYASFQTQWKVEEGDYLALERINKNFVHQNVDRVFDVWAFGCLMI